MTKMTVHELENANFLGIANTIKADRVAKPNKKKKTDIDPSRPYWDIKLFGATLDVIQDEHQATTLFNSLLYGHRELFLITGGRKCLLSQHRY